MSAPEEHYDHERELAADRRFERRLLVKEVVVVTSIGVLVALRLVTGL